MRNIKTKHCKTLGGAIGLRSLKVRKQLFRVKGLHTTCLFVQQAKKQKRKSKMKTYEISYEVVGSGAGQIKEVVSAGSDHNARNLIYAKYKGQTVRIWGSHEIR